MDQIYKLQPHRTMALQGFDDYGAAAALWGASDTGFTVSGVFRDMADFAVLVLFQKDDPFGHPLFSYLPDGDLTGLVLDFDVTWSGIQSWESLKSAWTDWNALDYSVNGVGSNAKRWFGTSGITVTPNTTGRAGASATYVLNLNSPQPGDKVTLWYQNLSFVSPAISASHPTTDQAMWWQGNAAYNHWVTIGSATYSCLEDSLNSASVANNIAGQINASDLNCTATTGGAYGNEIFITLKAGVAGPVAVSSSDGSAADTLSQVSAATILQSIAQQINAVNWTSNGPVTLSASVSGSSTLVVTAAPGADGNMVGFYQTDNNSSSRLYFTATNWNLSGGSSDNVSWHVHIEFSTLGWSNVDKVWWTIAPALPNGQAYQPTEWQMVVTNWTVTDSGSKRPLKVAGPGSVRIEEDNPWVVRSGYWEDPSVVAPVVSDFWSLGRAIRSAYSSGEARKLTIETHCQSTHDIYVGTRLDTNCGIVSASLDGGTPVTLDCYCPVASTGQLRRPLFTGVPAGQHSVVIALTSAKNSGSSGWYFYFDFLECAVKSDVPDAPQTRTDAGVATDFDTDNTYKLSPQRLVWNIQKLGLIGEIDHYCGVFWWKQSVAASPSYPQCTVTFSGNWNDQDVAWLHVGGSAIGKTVFGGQDTNNTIAQHFANFINAIFDGVWATAAGSVLTITSHSFGSTFQFHVYTELPSSNTGSGQAAVTGDLQGGTYGATWVIDPTQTPVLNRAFRDWHADYFALLYSAGIGVTVSFSQELVNPPDNPSGGAVWVQRYPDNTPVQTSTGFGSLYSSQAAFGAPVESYMAKVYAGMAALMAAASLAVRLQFGEVLWWYQANTAGMAFYDADTTAAAQAALGRALATFHTPNDDPSVNSYADANFLHARLKAYVDAIRTYVLASYPAAVFELLWPMDVNDPDTCRLTRYINLPTEWQARAGSGFDTFLCEGFEYGGIDHNIDQAQRCAAYPFAELSWDQAHCRYLEGWYSPGWPWQREYLAARRTGVPLIKFWAYDHLCLFGWPLPLPVAAASPSFI